MSTIDFKLADIKLESSEAHLLKRGKYLSNDFKIINIFCKNTVSIPYADISDVLILKRNLIAFS